MVMIWKYAFFDCSPFFKDDGVANFNIFRQNRQTGKLKPMVIDPTAEQNLPVKPGLSLSIFFNLVRHGVSLLLLGDDVTHASCRSFQTGFGIDENWPETTTFVRPRGPLMISGLPPCSHTDHNINR